MTRGTGCPGEGLCCARCGTSSPTSLVSSGFELMNVVVQLVVSVLQVGQAGMGAARAAPAMQGAPRPGLWAGSSLVKMGRRRA